jgi:rhodanese-related sulfurtransferase
MGKQKKKNSRQPSWTPLARKVSGQVLLLAGLSIVLGLMFNASNPLGIQWTQSAVAAQLPADPVALPEDEIPEIASNIVSLPPAPSVDVRSVADIFPPLPPTPETHGTPLVVHPGRDPVPMPPAPPPANPVGPAVPMPNVHPADANPVVQNPTPIRWPEVEALADRDGAVLVDARSRHAYEAAHIPGAVSLPNASAPAEIQAFIQKFPPGTKLVIYCGNERCSLSRQLAFKLVHQYGYTDVRYMPGGIQEWQQAQLRH